MSGGTKIDNILNKLQPESLPVFNKTVQEILSITGDEDSSAMELSRVILSDPSMTTHILQVANRVPYNPSAEAIATVSQAVLILGFESISRLSLTKALIDSLMQGNPQKYLLELVSQSLHAAVQAQSLAQLRKDPSPEDVFIATLLKRIGDIALWSISPENSEQVARLMEEQGLSMEQAQRQVYGFSGSELSHRLSHEWQLGNLLSEATSQRQAKDPRIACITAGESVAKCFADGGDSDLEDIIPQIKSLWDKGSDDKIMELISSNAEEARDMAMRYGLPVERVISSAAPETPEEVSEEEAPEPTWLEADPGTQLRILGEISALLEGKPDINLLLEMVAEGIYRGLGMDTVFFALLAPDRQTLTIRYILSHAEEHPVQRTLPVTPQRLIEQALGSGQALWYPRDSHAGLDEVLAQQCQEQDFFIKSITIGKQTIGLFYADRAMSRRPLDPHSFSGFRQFCQQANLGLTFVCGK
jgi:HD-like signal output (HDOD) protein